jgi:hypothetical protein
MIPNNPAEILLSQRGAIFQGGGPAIAVKMIRRRLADPEKWQPR